MEKHKNTTIKYSNNNFSVVEHYHNDQFTHAEFHDHVLKHDSFVLKGDDVDEAIEILTELKERTE